VLDGDRSGASEGDAARDFSVRNRRKIQIAIAEHGGDWTERWIVVRLTPTSYEMEARSIRSDRVFLVRDPSRRHRTRMSDSFDRRVEVTADIAPTSPYFW
jgi:hypothetical protein